MPNTVWILILAAGQSKRFIEVGYTVSKPLLRVKSKEGVECSMLSHVEDSIPVDYKDIMAVFPVGADTPNDFSNKIIRVSDSIGQAHTAYQVTRILPLDDTVIILDCDMILSQGDIRTVIEMTKIYDVAMAVTKTFDPNASRIDEAPFPTRFVEKEPISEYGIVGIRGFKSCGIITRALEKTLEQCNKSKIEPYLSMAINFYPGVKYAHRITKYVDLGTPDRIKQSGWTIVDERRVK